MDERGKYIHLIYIALVCFISEGWESGLIHRFAKPATRKGPLVRIQYPPPLFFWRDAGVVERGGLENR